MPYRVKIVQLRSGAHRPIFLDTQTGLPIPAPNLWCDEILRFGDEFNTAKSYLHDLIALYEWADSNKIDLLARFSSLTGFKGIEIRNLVDHLSICRRKSARVSEATLTRRILTIKAFCLFQLDRYLDRTRFADDKYNSGRAIRERTKQYFSRLSKRTGFDQKSTEPLSDELLEMIATTISPENPDNPFKNEAHKVRNLCIFHLAIDGWLRRSEVVLLELQDVELGATPALTVKQPNQRTRYRRKDGASLKTKGKVVPLSNEMASLLSHYIKEVRPLFVNPKRPSKSLFLSERDGGRLSSQSLNRMMSVISDSLNKQCKGLYSVHPHMLRATGATNFRIKATQNNSGDSPVINHNQLRDVMSYMGGWKYDSEMPRKYSKEAIRAKVAEIHERE